MRQQQKRCTSSGSWGASDHELPYIVHLYLPPCSRSVQDPALTSPRPSLLTVSAIHQLPVGVLLKWVNTPRMQDRRKQQNNMWFVVSWLWGAGSVLTLMSDGVLPQTPDSTALKRKNHPTDRCRSVTWLNRWIQQWAFCTNLCPAQ